MHSAAVLLSVCVCAYVQRNLQVQNLEHAAVYG